MFIFSRYTVIGFFVLLAALFFFERPKMDEEKYAIEVEWFDEIASLNRIYTLFYYINDQSVEMYDLKQKKTFLKRSHCETISEPELYIGNNVSVFGRNLKIVKYLDDKTADSLQQKTERTYAMLKPEVIHQMGKILNFIEGKGYLFNKLMLTKLSPKVASEFYIEHQGKDFYDNLVTFMASGPVLAMELLAPSAIKNWRITLGPTNSETARSQAPNSLRAHFAQSTTLNAAHGSDSPQAARRELDLIFNNQKSYIELSDHHTLCLIKPHIIQEGKLGEVIAHIQENAKLVGLKMHRLSVNDAERFFEAYKGVWEEYAAQIKQFTSGPLVAIVVASDVNTFRDFTGPFDPEVARQLQPNSLRGKFGRDMTHNAVHCTDLPNDGTREVNFFFKGQEE